MPAEKITRTVPIRDQVYDKLRQEILSGVLEPGIRIIEEEICRRYHVSRTPVRESLRKLENEKLLVHIPNKGAVVASWSEKDVDEIFRLRVALEKLVISVVMEKMTPEIRSRVQASANHLKQIITNKAEEKNPLFEEFHTILHEAAEMPRLSYMLKSLQDYLYRVHHLLRRNPERRKTAYQDHFKIAQAILRGDKAEAERITGAHLDEAYRFFLIKLEEERKEKPDITF